MDEKKISPTFKVVKGLLRLFYPRIGIDGTENLPDEPAIIVANHAQLHGPICSELYFPGKKYTWCAAEMMKLKEVPEYAFQDFWSQKPKRSQWYYRLASYAIAPLSALIFNNADTIGVYRDARIISTFRATLAGLQEGANIIIFPERDSRHNHIVYDFQEGFVDVARLYYRKTGKAVSFVPMYIAPRMRKMVLGEPVRFCADNPIEQERRRICDSMMAGITELACALPEHKVVPYRNISKRQYPKNTDKEVFHK